MKNKKYFFLNAFIIYVIILIPSLHTPMQSDDYSYFIKGISFDKTLAHYMSWSGRLVTDFTSSFLLNYLPYTLYEMVNAFVFLLMCIAVSLIPLLIANSNKGEKKCYYPSSIILWLVFMAYWIANPQLGHTSFWIVGSANYLWTSMWASIYICYLLYLANVKNVVNKFHYIGLFILGFLAGCSNENTSVSVVLFTIFVFFIEKTRRKTTVTGLVASIIGSVIMLGAPGNYVRLSNPLNAYWTEVSTIKQLIWHVVGRIPEAIAVYLHIYLLLIAVSLFLLWQADKVKINKKALGYASLFIILSIFANLVLTKSPGIGGRSLNTGLFFLLPSVAILVFELYKLPVKSKIFAKSALLCYCALFFIPSYLLFTFMMMQANIQHEIQEDIILKGKEQRTENISIPNYFITRLLKKSDVFDLYKSHYMPLFYGVKKITWDPSYFNYAILKTVTPTVLNKNLTKDLNLVAVYSYKSIEQKSRMTFEFNKSLGFYAQNDDDILFIRLVDKDNNFINVELPLDEESRIDDKYYFDIDTKGLNLNNVKLISFGFYNSKAKQHSQRFELALP